MLLRKEFFVEKKIYIDGYSFLLFKKNEDCTVCVVYLSIPLFASLATRHGKKIFSDNSIVRHVDLEKYHFSQCLFLLNYRRLLTTLRSWNFFSTWKLLVLVPAYKSRYVYLLAEWMVASKALRLFGQQLVVGRSSCVGRSLISC